MKIVKKISIILLFSLILLPTYTFGQIKRLTTSVYFRTDKYDLQEKQKQTIDSLVGFLDGKEINKIYIKGNTDNDADSLYNIALSKKRATEVQKYLMGSIENPKYYSTNYYGENIPIVENKTEQGKKKNRRVDITVLYEDEKTMQLKQEAINSLAEVKLDTCQKDTTIFLPQGSSFKINLCDYFKYKDCLTVQEYITPESILNSGLNTVSTANEQLETKGMFEIKICNTVPLKHPLIFRLAAECDDTVSFSLKGRKLCPDDTVNRNMKLWNMKSNGQWGNSKKVKTVKEGNCSFYEFEVNGSGFLNLDIKMKKSNTNTKLKAKGKVKIIKVRLLTVSPQTVLNFNNPIPKNKIKISLPSCPRPLGLSCYCNYVYVEGINAIGDTITLKKCLAELKGQKWFPRCKLKNGGVLLSRKYKIRRLDWDFKPNIIKEKN